MEKKLVLGSAILVLLILVAIVPIVTAEPQYQPDLEHWNDIEIRKIFGALHSVKVYVKNTDQGIAYGPFKDRFHFDDVKVRDDETHGHNMYEGDDCIYTTTFIAQKGEHWLNVTIDYFDDVPEDDETNNVCSVYRNYWWL